jgi:hypothetical protein
MTADELVASLPADADIAQSAATLVALLPLQVN